MALETVMVGYDGSDASRRAYDFARRVVTHEGRLVVVSAHVPRSEIDEAGEEQLRAERREALAELVAGAVDPVPETVVRDGYPSEVLAELADELDADLVVIGSRHRSALTQAVLGSVGSALTAAGARPVAIVP